MGASGIGYCPFFLFSALAAVNTCANRRVFVLCFAMRALVGHCENDYLFLSMTGYDISLTECLLLRLATNGTLDGELVGVERYLQAGDDRLRVCRCWRVNIKVCRENPNHHSCGLCLDKKNVRAEMLVAVQFFFASYGQTRAIRWS